MEHGFETYYRAVRSRDPRFDGRFFTAVTSTGIYCRPICPARTPQPQNVRFFARAAAAEAAGFRACRRCRPESSPGSPDWDVRGDLVARALRLIDAGAADEGVPGLARRLAVSERHLHRELVAAVGVGPLALARTHRAHTARQLLDQTDLPLTALAFAAGFSSVRQFNASIQESFGCTPTELRRRARRAPSAAATGATAAATPAGGLTLRLHFRPPLGVSELMAFLGRRAIPGIEEVVEGRYRRTVALPRSTGVLELEPVAGTRHVVLRATLDDLRDLSLLVQRCRRLLDLDAEPGAIAETLTADPVLAPLVAARPGLRVPGTVDGWELAVRAILGQQISVAGARTLGGRLVAALGEPLPAPSGDLTRYFPRPEAVADADLRPLGMTERRAATVRALARAVASGQLVLDRGADRDETDAALQALPGVGPWTAAYVAMRALGDPDAFLATDLGISQAAARLGLPPRPADLTARAEAWRPWRAYATMHLWMGLADAPHAPSTSPPLEVTQ
jgi:AraC family transcriptional regulator of adaptative response / DNA-3-methyladenine glycosylase II